MPEKRFASTEADYGIFDKLNNFLLHFSQICDINNEWR